MKKVFQNKLSRFNIPQFFNKIRFLKQWHRQTWIHAVIYVHMNLYSHQC